MTGLGAVAVAAVDVGAVDAAAVDLSRGGTSVVLALTVGLLFATGTYLILQRALTRIVVGLGLLTHAGNLLLLAAGGGAGRAAFVDADGAPTNVVDPLPQGLALTAVVISFSVTSLLLALTYRSFVLVRDDAVMDDPEDRRILAMVAPDDPRRSYDESMLSDNFTEFEPAELEPQELEPQEFGPREPAP